MHGQMTKDTKQLGSRGPTPQRSINIVLVAIIAKGKIPQWEQLMLEAARRVVNTNDVHEVN